MEGCPSFVTIAAALHLAWDWLVTLTWAPVGGVAIRRLPTENQLVTLDEIVACEKAGTGWGRYRKWIQMHMCRVLLRI